MASGRDYISFDGLQAPERVKKEEVVEEDREESDEGEYDEKEEDGWDGEEGEYLDDIAEEAED